MEKGAFEDQGRRLRVFLRDRRNFSDISSCEKAKKLSVELFDNLHPLIFKQVVSLVIEKRNFSSVDAWLRGTSFCKNALTEAYYKQMKILFESISVEQYRQKFRTKIRKELVIGISQEKALDLLTESRFIAQEKFLQDTLIRVPRKSRRKLKSA